MCRSCLVNGMLTEARTRRGAAGPRTVAVPHRFHLRGPSPHPLTPDHSLASQEEFKVQPDASPVCVVRGWRADNCTGPGPRSHPELGIHCPCLLGLHPGPAPRGKSRPPLRLEFASKGKEGFVPFFKKGGLERSLECDPDGGVVNTWGVVLPERGRESVCHPHFSRSWVASGPISREDRGGPSY